MKAIKTFLVFNVLFFYAIISLHAQRFNQSVYESNLSCRNMVQTRSLTDETYDVKHYHIDIEVSIDTHFIEGNVLIIADALVDLSTITLDLDSAYHILNIDGAASYTFADDEIVVTLDNSVLAGEEFTLKVYYRGIPPLAGGYKGLRYETHGGDQPIIATLSTPYLSHTWWPCNDGTKDKADSVYVDITIDDRIVSGIQLQAISNGLLDEIVSVAGGKLKYKWKHNYPIVPYYVMIAISNYSLIEQYYDNGSESFPLTYYVFNSSLSSATDGVADIPDVIDLFSNLFGPYPFADEKYGMTELGYYGAIENQTNTIINNMGTGWFMVSVHELSHMWFADMITCSDWHHGWVNEGFATYAEALWIESSQGTDAYHAYVEDFEYYDSGTIYMPDVSDPFSVFQPIIYNKGGYTLHMLRHVLGDAVFFESIYQYAQDAQYQYQWATTENFQEVCESVSGLDLSDFFDQWIYDAYYPKYQIDFYQDDVFQTKLGILQTQNTYGWRPVFKMPIDVKFNFTDGTSVTQVVENSELFQIYDFSFSKEIQSVDLDPDKWILKTVSTGDFNLSIKNEKQVSDIVIYPNPVYDKISITASKSLNKMRKIQIFDIKGVLIDQIEISNFIGDTYVYDVSKLLPGFYFIEINFENGNSTKKILKV